MKQTIELSTYKIDVGDAFLKSRPRFLFSSNFSFSLKKMGKNPGTKFFYFQRSIHMPIFKALGRLVI